MNKYKLLKNINLMIVIMSIFVFIIFIFTNSFQSFNPDSGFKVLNNYMPNYYTLAVNVINDIQEFFFFLLLSISIAMMLVYSLGFFLISYFFKRLDKRGYHFFEATSIVIISMLQLIFGFKIISTFILAKYIIDLYYFINIVLLLLIIIAVVNLIYLAYCIYLHFKSIKINYYLFATTTLKILAILLFVIVSFDIIFAIVKYIIILFTINNLEMTTLISVTNLFNIDVTTPFSEYKFPIIIDYFNNINLDLSKSLSDFGLTNEMIDQALINNVFVYLDQVIKNILLSISKYFIFKNLMINIFGVIFSLISFGLSSYQFPNLTKISDYIIKLIVVIILLVLYIILISAPYNIFISIPLTLSAFCFIYLISKNNDTIKSAQ